MTKAIRILQAAIARSEDALEEMRQEHADRGGCPCCVGAAFGGYDGPYDRRVAKLQRQEDWMSVLVEREEAARKRPAEVSA